MSALAPEDAPSLDVRTASDDEALGLIEDLVGELSDAAFERERVLSKLDIRGAARARRIGRELTLLSRGLAVATDATAREEVMGSLGVLLEEAHDALSTDRAGAPASAPSAPPVLGERPTPPDAHRAEGAEEAADTAEERPTSHGLPRLWDEAPGFDEETIARKASWARSGNRVLGK